MKTSLLTVINGIKFWTRSLVQRTENKLQSNIENAQAQAENAHVAAMNAHIAIEDVLAMTKIKSDWNQNDVTAVDYVKNRPMYIGHKDKIAFMCTAESSKFDVPLEGGLIPGNRYCLSMDNNSLIEYTPYMVASSYSSSMYGVTFYYIGGHPLNVDVKNTEHGIMVYGEPHLNSVTVEIDTARWSVDVNGGLLLRLHHEAEVVHTLDEKFIPDTIARIDDIPKASAVANVTDAPTASDFNALLLALRNAGLMEI